MLDPELLFIVDLPSSFTQPMSASYLCTRNFRQESKGEREREEQGDDPDEDDDNEQAHVGFLHIHDRVTYGFLLPRKNNLLATEEVHGLKVRKPLYTCWLASPVFLV